MVETRSIALGNISVAIGMPTHRDLPPQTVTSLLRTMDRLIHLGVPCDVLMEITGSVIMGRDAVLDDFLRGDKQKLFWIDSDMVWEPDDFVRMLAISTSIDVLTAAYPAKVDGEPKFFAAFKDGPAQGEFGLFEIDGIGLGFTVVDRKICQELADKAPRVRDQIAGRDMASVFRFDVHDGNRRTEDMAFFADVRGLGHKVWLDPMVSLGHVGMKEFRGSVLTAMQVKAQAA
jgi:hypothetical protein